MEIEYTLQAKEDLSFWKKSNNVAVLKKIRKLIEAILQSPYDGIGKPEPLKYKKSSHLFFKKWLDFFSSPKACYNPN